MMGVSGQMPPTGCVEGKREKREEREGGNPLRATVPQTPCEGNPAQPYTVEELLALSEAGHVLRRMGDAELASEIAYCERELLEVELKDEAGQGYWQYQATRLQVLQHEADRREGLAVMGGPAFANTPLFAPDFIAQVKEALPLDRLMERDILIVGRSGSDRFRYVCPLHHDHEPSGVIYANQGRWHCFGCNQGGDALDWLLAMHHLSFVDGVRELARLAGVEVPKSAPVRKGVLV